jgi:hypothetical protein
VSFTTLVHLGFPDRTDPRLCDFCTLDGDENAHTMREYLPNGMAYLREAADKAAVATVAEVEGHELICWCGHSLHYQDCPSGGFCHDDDDAHAGACRLRYLEDVEAIRDRWYCVDAKESDHWPASGDWLDPDDHSAGYSIECGHCSSHSLVVGSTVEHDADAP